MSDSREMRTWIVARAAGWKSLVGRVSALQAQGNASVEEALGAVEAYRGLARDLATARRVAAQSRTTAGLESLYAQLHALITRRPIGSRRAVATLFRTSIPRAAAAVRGRTLLMASLLACGALVGWWLISTYPALISLLASPKMIDQVEHGHLWTEGIINVTPSSILSISILANNIMVSIMAFGAGIFLGLATFYLVTFNGLMLGAVFAFVAQHGLAGGLLKFIIAHGTVELSVICIAGACGVALGESIIRPSLATRRDSFEACAHQLAPLLLLCAALLVGCGFIEGFISPDPDYGMASRVVIGVCYFAVMLILMSGRLFAPSVRRAAGG